MFGPFLPAQQLGSKLAITQAGVQSAEDQPFISTAYQFRPGDTVYFTFQVIGFQVRTTTGDNPASSIALAFIGKLEDEQGVPLVEPVRDDIAVELNPEDKNWSPKRRLSFQLPRLLSAGHYRVRITVHDLVAQTEAEQSFNFDVGGFTVLPSRTLGVQNILFFRSEDDREPLPEPVYAAGDNVYVRFIVVGFNLAANNRYRVQCSLQVTSPDGRPYLKQANQIQLDDQTFYPARYLPVNLSIDTSKASAKGTYSIALTVQDLVVSKSQTFHSAFSIE